VATPFRVVLITAPRGRKAEALAKGLVAAKLAACVNIVPGIVSHYAWKGKKHRDAECLLIAKTSTANLRALTAWVEKNHPYDVPEVLALKVEAGSSAYLKWLARELR
ncbi:MAG: divalent-cation tolerance protein CutA, partial [Phycisphaerales bacterium]|nr:divalent-cation tolerance protein CutA [Phycisphaerales bacterium]